MNQIKNTTKGMIASFATNWNEAAAPHSSKTDPILKMTSPNTNCPAHPINPIVSAPPRGNLSEVMPNIVGHIKQQPR